MLLRRVERHLRRFDVPPCALWYRSRAWSSLRVRFTQWTRAPSSHGSARWGLHPSHWGRAGL